MSDDLTLTCDICGTTTTTKGLPFTVQTLGMHKYHSHRIPSAYPRRHKKKPRPQPVAPIVSDDLVTVVLEQMFPKGIPVESLAAVLRWRDATIEFMKEVS